MCVCVYIIYFHLDQEIVSYFFCLNLICGRNLCDLLKYEELVMEKYENTRINRKGK